MWSTYPPVLFPDPMLDDPFPNFDGAFTTPWECPYPIKSNSGSDTFQSNECPEPVILNSCSDDSNPYRNEPKINPGLDESNKEIISIVDERKRRRMVSNRESARRSRMRKQKHLENLRNQANRLRIENRELSNRLRFALYHCHLVGTDNERLESELVMLQQKLWDIRQTLISDNRKYNSRQYCRTTLSCRNKSNPYLHRTTLRKPH